MMLGAHGTGRSSAAPDRSFWRGMLTGGVALLAPEALYAQDKSGVAIEGTYTLDALAALDGGIDTGARAMGLIDVVADVDGSVIGAEDVSFHLDVQLTHGGGFSEELVGDAQVVSNIDAPSGLRPLEAFVAASFGATGQGAIAMGLIDLNGIFDVQEVGALFLNSSHGIGPDFSQSGLSGPSIFPTTATAVTVTWEEEGWGARAGMFDAVAGDPDHPRRTVVRFPGESGLLLVGEVEADVAEDVSVQVGGWAYTSRFDAIERTDASGAPARLSGNKGAYGMVEGRLAPTLDAWIRVGVAETAINPIGLYLGGGLAYGAEEARLGLAVGHARLGDPARAAATASDRAETVIELTYALRLSERITVQPDVQYIVNPGWDPARDDALVAGVRLQLALF